MPKGENAKEGECSPKFVIKFNWLGATALMIEGLVSVASVWSCVLECLTGRKMYAGHANNRMPSFLIESEECLSSFKGSKPCLEIGDILPHLYIENN